MGKSLDRKLAQLTADPKSNEFILADAKDADMGFGIAATGPNPPGSARPFRKLSEFRQAIRDVIASGEIDIMLMSASTSERLTIDERLFDDSSVTPAVRANDTTDIWLGYSGSYGKQPSLPFRTASIDHIQSGRFACNEQQRRRGADLGLYSITLNNDAELDRATLTAYREFRWEAETKGFRHFLEVFAPNAPQRFPIADVPSFVNDSIARLLAGVTRANRPVFLKIPYFGAASMESLCHYDSELVVGILGGAAGTSRDAFQLLHNAKAAGARAALFGRKINQAEDQVAFVRQLRRVADGVVSPEQATRDYHLELSRQQLRPIRELVDDLQVTDPVLLGE